MMDSIQPWMFLCNSSNLWLYQSKLHIPTGNLLGRQEAQSEYRLTVQTYYLDPRYPGPHPPRQG